MRFANERRIGSLDASVRAGGVISEQFVPKFGPVAALVTRRVDGARGQIRTGILHYGSPLRRRHRYAGDSLGGNQEFGEHHPRLSLPVDEDNGQLPTARRRGSIDDDPRPSAARVLDALANA